MKKIKPTNALSIAIIFAVVAIFITSFFLMLYKDFGLFGNVRTLNEDFVVELVTSNDSFAYDDNVYLSKSREKFGKVIDITNNDSTSVVKIEVNGFFKNDEFFLNGKTILNINASIHLMNNQIEAKILTINKKA